MPSPDAPTAPDAPAVTTDPPVPPWRRWPARSVKLRLVLLFLALAAALALVFTLAAQQALRVGWRDPQTDQRWSVVAAYAPNSDSDQRLGLWFLSACRCADIYHDNEISLSRH